MLGRPNNSPRPNDHKQTVRPPAARRQPPATPREPASALPTAAWTPARFQVAPQAGRTRFHDLNLPDQLLHAIADLKFSYCTPIQSQILPALLAGRDAGGRAQTGTGKTAAFLIAVLARLLQQPPNPRRQPGTPRALVLAPTRELAQQIFKDARGLSKYCQLNNLVIFGGMDYKQQQAQLQRAALDLVVATPGRLLDFRSAGKLRLNQVEALVIDEADRMLDMGFIPDVKKIIYSLPPKNKRQTMLFSATLDQDILRLAERWMRDPLLVEIEPEQVTLETTEQRIYAVPSKNKFALLYNLLQREPAERVLVFRNRRDSVDLLARQLALTGIACAQLSGEVPQEKRFRILEDFRAGRIKVLVATDVAGRGIHVAAISHVINYDVPWEADDYVHRIGRTGRAGAAGIAITFACEEGAFGIPAIEKYIGRTLSCIQPEETWLELPEAIAQKAASARTRQRRISIAPRSPRSPRRQRR